MRRMNAEQVTQHLQSILAAAKDGNPHATAKRIAAYLDAERTAGPEDSKEDWIRTAADSLGGILAEVLGEDDYDDDDDTEDCY